MSNTVSVGISDLNIVKTPDVLVTYALGSCVGICLYDAALKIAGMIHIMLPDSSIATNSKDIHKFADTGIVDLLKRMEGMGANRARLKAKIAGGAQMFAGLANTSIANIGQRNVLAVKAVLSALRIPIVAEDTGSNYGRTIFFGAEDGKLLIKSALKGEKTI